MLLLTDPVDEVWVGTVTEFDGKPLQSIAKGEVDLSAEGDESEAEREEQQKEFADLLAWMKDTSPITSRRFGSPLGSPTRPPA